MVESNFHHIKPVQTFGELVIVISRSMPNKFPAVVYPGIFKKPILIEDFSNFKYDTFIILC